MAPFCTHFYELEMLLAVLLVFTALDS